MITKSALEKLLKSKIVEIKFNKKDGSNRTMLCSLKSEFLPKKEITEIKKSKKEHNNVLSVWDLEKDSFRSFRIDSITNYQVVSEGYEL
jgi:hypothetical protein